MNYFIIKEEDIIVAKKNDVGDFLLTAAAIIGGGFVFAEIMKMFAKKEIAYNCPKCNYDMIQRGMNQCPSCHSNLSWSEVDAARK